MLKTFVGVNSIGIDQIFDTTKHLLLLIIVLIRDGLLPSKLIVNIDLKRREENLLFIYLLISSDEIKSS